MATVTRRSVYLSTTLHAALVLVAFAPRGCSPTPPTTPPPQASAMTQPTPPARTPQAAHPAAAPRAGAQVLAPLTVPAPPLPPLDRLHQPLPGDRAVPITAVNTDHPGSTIGAGSQGANATPITPPPSSPHDGDLIAQMRAHAISNLELSHEEKLLRTTQEFLEDLLNIQVQKRWRAISARVRQMRLIIEVSIAPTGEVQAHLVNSSGDAEFDLAVEDWLHSPDLRLPPIKPGIRYPFLVVIRR